MPASSPQALLADLLCRAFDGAEDLRDFLLKRRALERLPGGVGAWWAEGRSLQESAARAVVLLEEARAIDPAFWEALAELSPGQTPTLDRCRARFEAAAVTALPEALSPRDAAEIIDALATRWEGLEPGARSAWWMTRRAIGRGPDGALRVLGQDGTLVLSRQTPSTPASPPSGDAAPPPSGDAAPLPSGAALRARLASLTPPDPAAPAQPPVLPLAALFEDLVGGPPPRGSALERLLRAARDPAVETELRTFTEGLLAAAEAPEPAKWELAAVLLGGLGAGGLIAWGLTTMQVQAELLGLLFLVTLGLSAVGLSLLTTYSSIEEGDIVRRLNTLTLLPTATEARWRWVNAQAAAALRRVYGTELAAHAFRSIALGLVMTLLTMGAVTTLRAQVPELMVAKHAAMWAALEADKAAWVAGLRGDDGHLSQWAFESYCTQRRPTGVGPTRSSTYVAKSEACHRYRSRDLIWRAQWLTRLAQQPDSQALWLLEWDPKPSLWRFAPLLLFNAVLDLLGVLLVTRSVDAALRHGRSLPRDLMTALGVLVILLTACAAYWVYACGQTEIFARWPQLLYYLFGMGGVVTLFLLPLWRWAKERPMPGQPLVALAAAAFALGSKEVLREELGSGFLETFGALFALAQHPGAASLLPVVLFLAASTVPAAVLVTLTRAAARLILAAERPARTAWRLYYGFTTTGPVLRWTPLAALSMGIAILSTLGMALALWVWRALGA